MSSISNDNVDLTKLSPTQLQQHVQSLNDQIKAQQDLIKKLRFDLDMEQGKVNILKHECKALKQLTVDLQATAEQEEEYISNTLLKRIECLKREKGELLLQVEREEEYLTNNLQRRLEKLQREKIEMENALEQEQEAIVNKLQKQLEFLSQQQSSPATAAATCLTDPSPFGNGAILPHSTPPPPKETVLEILRAEIHALRIKQGELEKEVIAKYNQALAYKKELVELRRSAGLPVEDLIGDDDPPSVMRCSPIPRPRVMSATSFTSYGHRSRSASASSFSSMPTRSRALSLSEPQSPFSHVPALVKVTQQGAAAVTTTAGDTTPPNSATNP